MGKTKIYNTWETIKSSFWFIPGIMILASVLASIITLELDHQYQYEIIVQSLYIKKDSLLDNFLTVGPEGARAVLTTVAGSMITVAGVTFSVTIVALTLAASQFGSRLLRNFMQDKSTQFVLGSFNSAFVYCLLVLRSIQSGQNGTFVPSISVNLAVVLAIVNVAILIFFIHHISVSLKAESVINTVYNSLKGDVDRIFSDISTTGKDNSNDACLAEDWQPDERYRNERELTAAQDGYLQAIDYATLMDIGTEHDLVIQLHCKPGDFAVADGCVATVRSVSGLDKEQLEEITAAYIYGKQRTPEQDIEYAIHQLVEVAVRSLSPGINDPFTAISCVDYLSAILCLLAQKKFPCSQCVDSQGEVRLTLKPVKYGDLLDSAFNQLRQHSRASVAVTIRLMEAFERIAECLKDDAQKAELARHVKMLWRASNYTLMERQDMADVRARYRRCVEKLEK